MKTSTKTLATASLVAMPNCARSRAPMTSPPITASGKNVLIPSRTNRRSTKAEGPHSRPGTRAHQPMPAPMSAAGPRGDDQRGCPARTRYGGRDLVKAVIDGQPCEEGDTRNSGQNGETAHLPAKSQTERHKLPRKSSFGAKLGWSARWLTADLALRRRWRRYIRGRKLNAIDQCPL